MCMCIYISFQFWLIYWEVWSFTSVLRNLSCSSTSVWYLFKKSVLSENVSITPLNAPHLTSFLKHLNRMILTGRTGIFYFKTDFYISMSYFYLLKGVVYNVYPYGKVFLKSSSMLSIKYEANIMLMFICFPFFCL